MSPPAMGVMKEFARRAFFIYYYTEHDPELIGKYEDTIQIRNSMIRWCDNFLLDLSNIEMKNEDYESQSNFVLYMKILINKSMDEVKEGFEKIIVELDWIDNHAHLQSENPELWEQWYDLENETCRTYKDHFRDLILYFERVHTMFKEAVNNKHYEDPEEYKLLKLYLLKRGLITS